MPCVSIAAAAAAAAAVAQGFENRTILRFILCEAEHQLGSIHRAGLSCTVSVRGRVVSNSGVLTRSDSNLR